MKEVTKGQSIHAALPSATSTWRAVTKHRRSTVKIAVGHLEKEQALDSALYEYCRLREQNREVTASQFCDRYPSYRQSLRRLIDVHDAMQCEPGLEEAKWPEVCSEFLGYEILHELGIGAIARVYLATEPALGGRMVAIKVSRHGGDEAETLGKLAHPNIVPVFSVQHDKETDMTAVCMPYYGSATLGDLLEIAFEDPTPPTTARVILDAAREREQVADCVDDVCGTRSLDPIMLRGTYVDGIVRLGIQMADALAFTHERGILHRDLKPSNVLLTREGVPMLLDFNLASDMETGARRLGGTLPYMPPEQIRDVHLHPFEANLDGDPRSDVFSLGAILYELLTGKLPFGDPPAGMPPRQAAETFLAAQQQDPRPVRELNPSVSPAIARLIHQCLALDPGQRPASAADLVAELRQYFTSRLRARRWTSRHRGLVTTLALLFALTTAAVVGHLATRPPFDVRQYKAGVADYRRDRMEDAIEHFSKALKVKPDSDAYLFARGVATQQLGTYDIANGDLRRVKSLENPLVLECAAFVAAHSPGNDIRARVLYGKLCKLDPSNAALQLNYAYVYILAEGRVMSGHAATRAEVAISLRPDWHSAYHFAALAYMSRAGLASRHMQNTTRDSLIKFETRERAKALEKSVKFIDLALSLAPDRNDEVLLRDALIVHTMPGVDEDLPRIKKLFELAVRAGVGRQSLEALGSDKSWSESAWFRKVLDASEDKAGPSKYLAPARFLTPPNRESIAAYLEAGP